MLTHAEQRFLLRIARNSIRHEMTKKYPARSEEYHDDQTADGALDTPFEQKGGAFVTLRIGSDLRGCIGYIEYPGPVRVAVEEVARKAAFGDPRFDPLGPEELGRVNIEISVLTPMRKITSAHDVVVGRDGLVIELRGHRGLLLPQVATEYGWTVEEFLENTSRKAGLPSGAWRDPLAVLYAFSAEVFCEKSVRGTA
jgi:AmmeMemoRadiSam system protein A